MSSPSSAVAPPPPPPPDMRLTFPPFPKPPPGVTIVPFIAFKERGIQMFPSQIQQTQATTGENDNADGGAKNNDEEEGGIELDGLGIPTVELRAKHDMDECKTETRRKRRRLNMKAKKRASTKTGGEAKRKEWWEIWEENEDLKGGGPYDPRVPALDRFYEAATDFRKSHSWPPNSTGISPSWDQFRLYVGLLSNTPVWTRTDKPAHEGGDDDGDSISSDEDKATVNAAHAPPRANSRPLPRPPYALYGADPISVSSDDQVQSLLNNETARRENQMLTFLNSPYPLIQTFLSSYLRKQGLIWADKNLINIPKLIGFFIRFLIRNEVFRGEKSIERELKRSVGLIETAERELILTSKIAKQVPDDASRAFKSCWGPKAEGYKPISINEPDQASHNNDNVMAEPDTDLFEGMEEIKVTDEFLNDAAKLDAIRDNLHPDVEKLPSWGTSVEGKTSWGATTGWGAPAAADWGPPQIFSLFTWLGPTALPITHTTGIVENSVRRIKSVELPKSQQTETTNKVADDNNDDEDEWKADAEKVETELDSKFAKVVLEPWLNWDTAEGEVDNDGKKGGTHADGGVGETPYMNHPRILPETSRGLVKGVVLAPDGSATRAATSTDDVNINQNDQPENLPDVTVPAHDPLTDTITLLIDPSVLSDMSPGMGLGGTWVQIARNAAYAHQVGGEKGKKKKKSGKGKGKGKKKANPDEIVDGKFWYVDELMLVLTSYHR